MDHKWRVNTVDAKNRLNELLSEIEKTKRPLVVERRGRPVAVLVDIESYEGREKAEIPKGKATLSKELLSFHARMKKKYPKGTGDSAEILAEIRTERGKI